MRLFLRSVVLCLCAMSLCCFNAFAQSNHQKDQWSFKITQGYTNHSLDWSIAGGGVNVLSELIFDDMHMYTAQGELTYLWRDGAPLPLLFDLDVAGGWALEGDGRDSDYLGDNRTFEFSRSTSSTEGTSLFDVSLGVGPVFELTKGVTLTPKVGYAYHQTNVDITDGVQVVSDFGFGVPLGPFSGLDSRYDASWHGPFGGAALKVAINDLWSFGVEGTVYYADYFADAHWNLRDDFDDPSFEHEADGYGYRVNAELERKFGKPSENKMKIQAALILGAGYEKGETDDGVDRTFFSDDTSATLPFNGANWESYSVYLALKYYF